VSEETMLTLIVLSHSAVDYFISGVLESAGVTDEIKKMNINLGKSCMQLAFVSQVA
jgi:hypothetical protein